MAASGFGAAGAGRRPVYGWTKIDRATAWNGWFAMPPDEDAVIGGLIALWRAIGGRWRAENDETENYVYAIAL